MEASILCDAVDHDIGAVGKPGPLFYDMVGRIVLERGMECPMDPPITGADDKALAFLY